MLYHIQSKERHQFYGKQRKMASKRADTGRVSKSQGRIRASGGSEVIDQKYQYTIPKDAIDPTLIELAEQNDKIVVMSSDVSVSCNIEMFHEQYPDRFLRWGLQSRAQ